MFDDDLDANKQHGVKDLMIRMQSYIGRRVKDTNPMRTNPEGVVGYELYRINYASYGKGAHTFIRDVRDNHKKIFVGDTHVFDGDVLQLLNINYELKYWDDILILPCIDIKGGYCTEGYYKAMNDLCVLVNRP